jgi:hypothetical protein
VTADLGYDDPLESPPKGVRATLADALHERLDESVKVVAQADAVTPEKGHDLVMVMLDEVQPGTVMNSRHVKAQVVVAVARTTPGLADDDLEDRLGEVLDALDDIDWLTWTSAKRSTYLPEADAAGFPAFSIDCEIEAH